jgi:hypothetical protein
LVGTGRVTGLRSKPIEGEMPIEKYWPDYR